METIELQADKRTIFGRKTQALREQGLIPAVLYGNKIESLPIQINGKDFEKVYKKAGESTLVYVKIRGQSYPTIIYDITTDPVSDNVIHADFYKVSLTEKITAKVPLVFMGESLAVKDLQGILVKNINEIEIEALPQDLPHNIEVDISLLKTFEDHILLKDLAVSDKLEIKGNPEEILALVQAPISEEELKKELETPTASAEEVEVIKKEKEEEIPVSEEEAKPVKPKEEQKK